MSHLHVLVRVMRGPILESTHRIHAALAGADGALAAAAGAPELVTTFRSAAKPFQLLPLVERGHAERMGFSDEELAVMAASHVGSAYHVRLVQGILARLGLSDAQLACGFHEPVDAESLAVVRRAGADRSPIYNNCSGKHAGMLAMCLAEGWPVEGYQRAAHPLQQLMHRTIAELCGVDVGSVPVAVDGCSVSVFAVPLAGMARAYARLVTASAAGSPRDRALARIRNAMRQHPVATGGVGRLSTELMACTDGRLIAKGGAEALECVGLPQEGLGLALKAEDGGARAVGPATIAVLETLGALAPSELQALAPLRRPVVTNHAGLEVGRIEAQVEAIEVARAGAQS